MVLDFGRIGKLRYTFLVKIQASEFFFQGRVNRSMICHWIHPNRLYCTHAYKYTKRFLRKHKGRKCTWSSTMIFGEGGVEVDTSGTGCDSNKQVG